MLARSGRPSFKSIKRTSHGALPHYSSCPVSAIRGREGGRGEGGGKGRRGEGGGGREGCHSPGQVCTGHTVLSYIRTCT